jgi:hypothetical protein
MPQLLPSVAYLPHEVWLAGHMCAQPCDMHHAATVVEAFLQCTSSILHALTLTGFHGCRVLHMSIGLANRSSSSHCRRYVVHPALCLARKPWGQDSAGPFQPKQQTMQLQALPQLRCNADPCLIDTKSTDWRH